jgi:hypothetical protein
LPTEPQIIEKILLVGNFSITWGLEDEKPGFSEKPGFFPRTIEMILVGLWQG